MAKRRKAAWLALGALALVVASVPAAAQDLDESLDEEARAIFQAGRTAYDAARYEDALRHFQHAYRLSTRPELLYNVALAADRLRRDTLCWEIVSRCGRPLISLVFQATVCSSSQPLLPES